MATVPNGASVAQIAAVFGLASNASISAIAAAVGVPANSPISTYYGRSPTPAPTPAPSFDTTPQLTPATGTAGATQYSIADPVVSNGTLSSRQFLLNGAVIGGGNVVTPGSAGTLSWRGIADGPGGSRTFISNEVQVVAAPVITQFSPEPGAYVENGLAGATVTLTCTTDAVWTYTRIAGPPNGAGTSVNVTSGGTAKSIRFGVAQTNTGGPQSARWTVRGTSNGVVADYDLSLNAEGTGGIN